MDTLRQGVLDALDQLWFPALPKQELTPVLQSMGIAARGREELERLLVIERRAFDTSIQRKVRLCQAIGPDLRPDPEGRWARSDWPLWVRVVDPHPRARRCHTYWMVGQLHSALTILDDPGRDPPGPLARLMIQRAGQLPTTQVDRYRRSVRRRLGDRYDWAVDRFAVWNEVAQELFDAEAGEDRRRREQVAGRLAEHNLRVQLFAVDSVSDG